MPRPGKGGRVERRGRAPRAATPPRRDTDGARSQVSREDLWRQLFEQVPEPAFIADAGGRLLVANAAAARLLETDASPLDGRPVEDLIVGRDRIRVRDLVARLQSSRRAVLSTQLGLRRAHGRGVSAAATLVALRGVGGRLRAIGFLLRRVGQPRPLAERLQRTRQEASELRLALDQAGALIGFDRRGRVNEVNERCCRTLARSRDELLGSTVDELSLGADLEGRLPEIRRTLLQGDVWGGEVRVATKNGGPLWLHCTVVPLLDGSGRPGHYLAILQDVSERQLANERLLEQEGLARLGAMAAVVAHEVRNPLAAARGALDVIGPRVASEDDRRILADVSERLSKLNDLVTDILLYARPRALALAETDLAELVDAAVGELRTDPLGRRVNVVLRRPTEPCRLRVDAGAVQRVIFNLLRNATQAMEGRGRIVASVECDDADRCRVRVRDQGPGVPEHLRHRIFEPFFTTRHKGSGLGLATARRTIELHGGRLHLLPAPGGGTDAVVELPRSGSAPAQL